MQSGKPVGVFRTHADAPRVLIANSNLVPHWATLDHFNELDRKGLMMYGQMTAGSWIYIGSQGIVQGTYETFAELWRRHYGGSLAGKWILTAGLGGMGGAQPLAATMAGASLLAIECQPSRIEMRLKTGYLDAQAKDLDEALAMMERAGRERKPVSIGLLGNAAEMLPELVRRGVKPDAVTDQTSAHDPINGYLPAGWTLAEWEARRADDPKGVERAAKQSMAAHVRAMLAFWRAGVPTFDYGNNIRQMAKEDRRRRRVRFSRLRAGLCPSAVLPRHRPIPLGGAVGRSRGHFSHRRQGEGADAERGASASVARYGEGAHQVPGPAGAHLLGRAWRPPSVGPCLQRDGGERRTKGADCDRPRPPRFRLGRQPQSRDRGMKDGSDAVSDWPLLNALLNCASGATWVSFHHGGGVGIGFSQHAGMVVVCDGTPEAARRIERVLWNDPASGVMRHADAGYEDAIACAREHRLKLPSLT